MEDLDLRPPSVRTRPWWALACLCLLLACLGEAGYLFWPLISARLAAPPLSPAALASDSAAAAVQPAVEWAPAAASAAPAESAAAARPASAPVAAVPSASAARPVMLAEPLPDLNHAEVVVRSALVEALGNPAVASFLRTDDFARRFVATVDNLAQEQSAERLWPVKSTAGELVVVERGEGPALADGNADRYRPFVRWLAAIDSAQAIGLYQALYPLFQQAYEELGYSGKHFNERVLEVIDVLLNTPEPQGPVRLVLPEIHGPIPSTRPWTRYQFADPDLERRPAGQKLLLRMGVQNASYLKAKLAELRVPIAEWRPPQQAGAPRENRP